MAHHSGQRAEHVLGDVPVKKENKSVSGTYSSALWACNHSLEDRSQIESGGVDDSGTDVSSLSTQRGDKRLFERVRRRTISEGL